MEKVNQIKFAIIVWAGATFILYIILSALSGARSDEEFKNLLFISAIIAAVGTTIFSFYEIYQIKTEDTKKAELERQKKEEKRQEEENKKKAIKNEINELKEKFGDEYGESIYYGDHVRGMGKEMVEEVDKRNDVFPRFKDGDKSIEKWYYNTGSSLIFGFDWIVSFQEGKVLNIHEPEEGVWLDMTKEVLIKACGQPEDEIKAVSKKGRKFKWYYGGRTTQQGTTVYEHEVQLENDLVVGWKELE